MQDKTTFTLAQAASLLSCHKETIRRAIKAGELRAAKLGKEYRISKADLEFYWRNKGGGALFDDSPMPPAIELPDKDKKKSGGPEQLKLPT